MLKKLYVSFVTSVIFMVGFAYAAPGDLPESGQKNCFDAYGKIACTDTGQDGEWLKGIAWPIPRFVTGADMTVIDNLSGLVWMSVANTPTIETCMGGTKNWQTAMEYVACLNANSYIGYTDWRLPNINELETLVNAGYTEETTCAGTCTSNAAWLNTQGFSNVQDYTYWSSTSYAWATGDVWLINMGNGGLGHYYKNYIDYYVLPVRGGQ